MISEFSWPSSVQGPAQSYIIMLNNRGEDRPGEPRIPVDRPRAGNVRGDHISRRCKCVAQVLYKTVKSVGFVGGGILPVEIDPVVSVLADEVSGGPKKAGTPQKDLRE